jgi:DNA-binding GntR family transcriptional regulator
MKGLRAIQPIRPIREVAYEKLKNAILSGAFESGERLVEHDIAERLRVSRTPVREALRRLESEGIVEALPKQGLVVKDYSDDEVREIYLIREALESLAAEYAARNASEDDIAELERLLRVIDSIHAVSDIDGDASIAAHQNFSETYNRASYMPTLVHMIESLKDQIARCRAVSLSGEERRAAALREHRELFEALRRRDAEMASVLTKRHLKNAAAAYFKSVGKDGGESAE